MRGVAAATAPLSANSACARADRGSRLTVIRLIRVRIASPTNHSVSARPIATCAGKRQICLPGHCSAHPSHAPVGADREQQVEQEGNRDQAHRLDEPESASAADKSQNRTAGVDDQRDRRPGRVETPDVRPRSRQLPESERIIALKGEDRESRGVERDQRRGIWALGPRPAQKRQCAGAGERGEDGLAERDRGVKGEHEQRRAAERRKRGGPARKRARKRGSRLHAFRPPRFAPLGLPRGLLTESQARVPRLPAAP